MKKDLKIPKVTGVEIAIVQRPDDDQLWDVYLINRNGFDLKNVLISSRGYGTINGEQQKTSLLRHLIELVQAKSAVKIEPIQKDVFHLANEYWVSYYLNEEIYDKKYIFLPESIRQNHIIPIDGFNMRGIVHK
jgi:hypothetical protein